MKKFLILIVTLVISGTLIPKLFWAEGNDNNYGANDSSKEKMNGNTNYQEDYVLNRSISVTVHLVSSGGFSATPITEFQNANTFFEPMKLNFKVCKIDTVFNHNYQRVVVSGDKQVDELLTKNYEPKTLNVYYVQEFVKLEEKAGGIKDTVALDLCAWIYEESIFIKSSCKIEQGKRLARQLGYYMGLYSTTEESFGLELPDGTNCATAGDLVCDTPADKVGMTIRDIVQPIDSCEIDTPLQIGGQYYLPLTNNLMSNYHFDCKERFTVGQFRRMATFYYANRAHLF